MTFADIANVVVMEVSRVPHVKMPKLIAFTKNCLSISKSLPQYDDVKGSN